MIGWPLGWASIGELTVAEGDINSVPPLAEHPCRQSPEPVGRAWQGGRSLEMISDLISPALWSRTPVAGEVSGQAIRRCQ